MLPLKILSVGAYVEGFVIPNGLGPLPTRRLSYPRGVGFILLLVPRILFAGGAPSAIVPALEFIR